MPSRRITLLALVAVELLGSSYALYMPIKARHGGGTALSRRASFSATMGNTSLNDFNNLQYISEITVGGTQFAVQLDTGSSDLNILGNVQHANDTTIPITVAFASGQDNGVLSFADVEFAGYTVPQQIFNHGPPGNGSMPSQGLLGLGPTSGSVLANTAYMAGLTQPGGDTLLDRIFQQNTSAPNFMSFNLGREEDPNQNVVTVTANGDFTIGELLPGMESITNMPSLQVLADPDTQGQHWTVLLDGATGPNGPITFGPSVVAGTPAGKLATVFDSGFSLPQVTQEIADGFYKNIPGAQLQNINPIGMIYVLPCKTAINASFTFSGQTYPIHPLDLNFNFGSGQCAGPFQPIQQDALSALNGEADMILGMAFLRNVYILMNFGDFVDSTADAKMQPFVQMLSTTNPAQATAEFNTVRAQSAGSSLFGGLSQRLVLGVALGAAVLGMAGL